MIAKQKLLGLGASLALLAALGWAPPAPAAPVKCLDGWTEGDWDLPGSPGGGWAAGKFVESSSGTSIFEFKAKLTATPSPCLSCIQGTIEGELDDGFGWSPDYIVKGEYSGLFFTGEGEFWAYIYDPSGYGPVGKVAGKFADPPFQSGAGDYKGEWSICP